MVALNAKADLERHRGPAGGGGEPPGAGMARRLDGGNHDAGAVMHIPKIRVIARERSKWETGRRRSADERGKENEPANAALYVSGIESVARSRRRMVPGQVTSVRGRGEPASHNTGQNYREHATEQVMNRQREKAIRAVRGASTSGQ